MECNPTEELGFREEKQVLCGCDGIVTANNYSRDLCGNVIRNGENFYDVVQRYEEISYFALNRSDGKLQPAPRMLIPFLKSYGLTDFDARKFAYDDLALMPGAKECFQHLFSTLPLMISTTTFEHNAMAVSEKVGLVMFNFSFTRAEFDSINLTREESKKLREMANRIASLKVPNTRYVFEDGEVLSDNDAEIIETLDDIFLEEIPKMDIEKKYDGTFAISTSEKAYTLQHLRNAMNIEYADTVYIGNRHSDSVAMEFVNDSNGLSMSFNGSEYAVRSSNIAVMSPDTTVLAVLATEFYDQGIQSVYDMVENWNRKNLQSRPFVCRSLMDRFLAEHPKKLPKVIIVDRNNVDEVVEECDRYRKKVEKCGRKY